MDFFTVPTANFGVLYGLFFIHHRTRRILHANVTAHPTAEWIIQQLREAFPDEHGLRFLVHDRDAKFGHRVLHALTTMGVESCPTSYRSPWQNGIAERWVGSCRRELLDHIVPFGEAHLRRLVLEYVRYHNEDRPHAFLGKGHARWAEASAAAIGRSSGRRPASRRGHPPPLRVADRGVANSSPKDPNVEIGDGEVRPDGASGA